MKKGNRTIGLLAHVDAGKTTTAENIIYQCGVTKELGNVNKGTSLLDHDSIEQARGITVFSDQVELNWKGENFTLIDTPGHVDFGTEMERSLKILDGAIMIISAADGVQAHTETIWALLKKHHIPTMIFINKMDRVGNGIDALRCQLKRDLGSTIFLDPDDHEERVIESTEALLERYIEGLVISQESMEQAYRNAVGRRQLVPVYYGCAQKGEGIEALLDGMIQLMPRYETDNSNISAYVYKVKVDDRKGKLDFVKVLSGELKVRQRYLIFGNEEKITNINKVIGDYYIPVEKLKAGELGAISGLTLKTGQGIGDYSESESYIKPVLSSRITYEDNEISSVKEALNILNLEDPLLDFRWNAERKEMTIGIMGTIHMEIVKAKLKERFNLMVELTTPFVHYMETITTRTQGFCHFEPKKHFAEVEVEIEPLAVGCGIEFESRLSVDLLPVQFQKMIEENIEKGLKHGPLLGAPVTDIKVTLIAGVHHLEHTHGGDFAIATIRAIQQALEKNECKIKEPMYAFKVICDSSLAGKIMADLSQRGCKEEIMGTEGEKAVLTGIIPVSKAIDYPIRLASLTGGKGIIQFKMVGYDDCHNEEDVLGNFNNHIDRDEKRYNSITLLRHKKKMKKIK